MGFPRPLARFVAVCALLAAPFAGAAETTPWPGNGLSRERFERLVVDLAPKVNLFRATWEQVPNAEFTGGTVRDYAYWVRLRLAAAADAAALDRVERELRALPTIDVREFVHDESDIDYFTFDDRRADIRAEDYGVMKFDRVNADRFRPGTAAYESEFLQGWIPIEKMRLARNAVATDPRFGDGLAEVFAGRPSARFPALADFSRSLYAQMGANHRILLVIRYLRTLSLNYAKTGHSLADYPKIDELLEGVPEPVREEIRGIVGTALDPSELRPLFKNASFAKWYRAAMEKSFRAYVHPMATYQLYVHFGLDRLVAQWPEKSIEINQYNFARPRQPRNLAEFDARIRELGFEPTEAFSSVEAEFGPRRRLFHGTRSEEAFRDILTRGIVASTAGTAGPGVYGVAETQRDFSIQWSGGNKDFLVEFEIAPSARVLDVTRPGSRAEALFRAAGAKLGVPTTDLDAIADYLGVDAYKYPYQVPAYVVKNGGVLGRARGVYRSVLTFNQALELATEIRGPEKLATFLESLALGRRFTPAEQAAIYANLEHFPRLLESLNALRSGGLAREPQALALFLGGYAVMHAAEGNSDYAPSRRFIDAYFLEPARSLRNAPAELAAATAELRKRRPPGFDRRMLATAEAWIAKASPSFREKFLRMQTALIADMPWQIFAFLQGFFITFANIAHPEHVRPVIAGIGVIADLAVLIAARKRLRYATRELRERQRLATWTREWLRSVGFADPDDCLPHLRPAEPAEL